MENKIVPTAYLSGVCTDENYSHRGFMTELMSKTHRRLFEANVWAATLIPADENLRKMYQKFGYSSIFSDNSEIFDKQNILQNNDYQIFELKEEEHSPAFEYFNKKNLERKFSLLATENYFGILCQFFAIEGKKILIAKEQQNIVGMAFMSEIGNILEFFFDNDQIKFSLLNYISQIYENQIIKTSFPLGMLRIINVEKFLSFYAENHPEKEIEINVFDENIAENCGNYCIKSGFSIKNENQNTKIPPISVKELAEIIFQNSSPKMTLMLNE
jgi:predicted acetyltransferase